MADYASLKVPELKKLLQEKSLPVTGNKADLIARLQEHDQAQAKPEAAAAAPTAEEDPIDYSDDDVPATTKPDEPAKLAEGTTVEAPASATEADKPAETTATEKDASAVAEESAEGEASEVPAAPKTDFSAHLPESSVDEETRKRAERAKRFGIVEENEEEKKKVERAERFGVDKSTLVKGLDSALPEKRERKRGREGGAGEGDGEHNAKRQHQQNGGRGNRSRLGRRGGGRQGGSGGRGGDNRKDGGKGRSTFLDDPTEKAKAEARAKRFAGA
ncbi:hypothetical protein F5X99DRAFT_212275 [Biscogniauxia marginata]|nr:hypothetical protein F5X99DRAFT_212275 [Biscogniauxia marginata]